MKQLLFFLSLFLSTLLQGQAVIKEIKEINPNRKSDKYIFPWVIIPGNKTATGRINNELIRHELEIEDRKKIKRSIFENVWATREQPTPMRSDFAYAVLNNDKRVLSMSVSAEGCGAYCEYATSYHSFDIRTGKKIILDSLFTPEGAKIICDSLTKGKRRMIGTEINALTDSLKDPAGRININDKERFERAKEMYEYCLELTDETNFEYLHFYFIKNTLFIIVEQCSAHMTRALDDIGDFKFSFRLKDWKNYLSGYATRLILL